MHIEDDTDNIFEEGTTVRLKENPSLDLRIVKYQQRIYYCVDTLDPSEKQMPYYERELLAPSPL